MGWSIYSKYNSPKNREEERKEIVGLFEPATGAQHSYEVLQASKVGTVWYVAVKVINPSPDTVRPYVRAEDGSYTFAAVILTSKKNGEWGYKDMTESMGPYYTDAPLKLLDLLSEIDPEDGYGAYALKWREAVRETHAAKAKTKTIKVGDKVRLKEPLRFTDGVVAQVFKMTKMPQRRWDRKEMRYKTVEKTVYIREDGSLCRLSAQHLENAEVVS
jgi:hypothetical protein